MKYDESKKTLTQGDIEAPAQIQVYIHDDDFTPMEFVVCLLEKFFYLSRRKAIEVMLEAHTKGRALCGIFSRDVAETKIFHLTEYAQSHEYPLLCSTEVA